MERDNFFEIEFLELLSKLALKLPQEDIKNIKEFTDNREWGLAYEILCIQVYEYNIQISLEFYKKISLLGESIGIQSSVWLPLKELIEA
jgi:hypothetical protein